MYKISFKHFLILGFAGVDFFSPKQFFLKCQIYDLSPK